ncbi:MAG: hypothetical protein RSE44_30015, partial [Pseudomonas sp.]
RPMMTTCQSFRVFLNWLSGEAAHEETGMMDGACPYCLNYFCREVRQGENKKSDRGVSIKF